MSTLLQSPGSPVARKKPLPSVQVRVSRDVAELAAIVAAYERTQSSDLLSEILRPILRERHARLVEAEAAKLSTEPGAKTPPKKTGGK